MSSVPQAPDTHHPGRPTAAQNTFWRRFKVAVDYPVPERFAPGKYRCPGHDDKGKSLKVDYRDNAVRLTCFSHNCSAQAVIDRLGVRWGDLSDYGPAVGGKPAGVFTYHDERGAEVLRVHRYTDPVSVRYQRFTPDGWEWASAARGPHVLYRRSEVLAAVEAEERVFVVDSEQAADALHQAGVVATTAAYRPPGKSWKPEYLDQLHGAYVTVVARRSEAGRKHARLLAARLLDSGATDVQVVEPATAKPGADAADHLAAGFGLDDLAQLDSSTPSDFSGTAPELPARCTLGTVEKLFLLLVSTGDKVALRAALATYAANMHLPGDAVWLGLVSGSSTGKTEMATALAQAPGVYIRATVSGEAALLSGTPGKDWAPGATGGLLRRISDHGVLVLKDFTSVLGMHREKRGVILAALREIYDGHWSREIGGEGGALLEWRGKLGLVMCCTTAYDRAHEVIAQMGDRFLLVRLDDHDPERGLLDALDGAGQEGDARAALAAAVAGLLGHAPEHQPLDGDSDDRRRVAKLANFVTLARSPVARDYRGEIDLVMDREAPHRFGKQLYALWRACGLLGMTREQAWEVAQRVARDSLPKLRWRTLAALADGGEQSTNTVARAVNHPYRSTKRTLEDLAAHGVVARTTMELEGAATKDFWRLTDAGEATKLLLGAMPEMSGPTPTWRTTDDDPRRFAR